MKRPEKTAYLVVYDYGAGGVWATIMAPSAAAIASKYPLLKVIAERPSWMDDNQHNRLPRYDIDQEPDDFLRTLKVKRRSSRGA
ncbi:MAG TPA: hypothetical protein VIE16_01575 [Phenylobacterium sp.]|jgi:hypothetical protein